LAKDIITPAIAYWERLRGERTMPRRQDIDPVDIPRLLPFVMLVDVLDEPLDFRFRLIGGEVQTLCAPCYIGRRFSELPHMARGNKVWAAYEAVVDGRRPLTGEIDYIGDDRRVRRVKHCLMPLSQDGSKPNMVFVAVEIERR
jgi:hypothetical protein